MQTTLAYRDDFSVAEATPLKITNDASSQWFPSGGPNGGAFRRFFISTTTDDTYSCTNTRINSVNGSLGPRSGSRQAVLAYWYRIPSNFVPFEVGFHKVFYVNRTTTVSAHRPLIQFGYGGGRGWYSLTNNTENPFMATLARFDPYDYLDQFVHSIVVLDLDDTTLIGQRRTDGQTVTTAGTYSLYITVPGTNLRNTIIQRECVLENTGGWGTFDFLGQYGPARRNRQTHIDIGRWGVLL